ncbi:MULTISPECIES: DUF6817 domain-containing protein [unclassified Leptolyngbya]|uniref:DUF6817 domain-containing protein n=1 Tax=unclassified Leptolyngbya TaxID=2650499 RepID=UPI00168820D8|nr:MULTISPECIES: hypothetical protein [unclassified Leptolyngbya]MBD1913584.1 hypothetical protein [Leptolyngbya sp. FACHB-8]MBD2155845.1 hypothetical protein [Leptolyngbya sp. FACHB-16]
MHAYAQTNLQLYNQLVEANYSEPDLQYVLKGYELAITLFSGRYRANGKPFLAHLVGTASILVAQKAPIQVVVAGLLHAAYAQGNFGSDRNGVTKTNQKTVIAAVGAEIESLIAHYTAFPWNVQSMEKTLENISTLTPVEQQIILIRLANDLEDHLDFGMLYCQKLETAPIADEIALATKIGNILGYASLVKELSQTFQESTTVAVPNVLKRNEKVSFNSSPQAQSSSAQWQILKNRLPSPIVSSLKQARAFLRT